MGKYKRGLKKGPHLILGTNLEKYWKFGKYYEKLGKIEKKIEK